MYDFLDRLNSVAFPRVKDFRGINLKNIDKNGNLTIGFKEHVIFPEIKPALLMGTALSFTRSLGEFGAVIFIAGNIPWQTEVTSLMIFIRLQEFDYAAAAAIASVVLLVSLVLLFVINGIQQRYQHISGALK